LALKILHFADLHLDTSFARIGFSSTVARFYREQLREALKRILKLAQDEKVDLITCGGDLYEHERYTSDTGKFLQSQFENIERIPVLLVPGNHDPYLPDSLYRRLFWPSNVKIVTNAELMPVWNLGEVTIWAFAHLSPTQREAPLNEFKLSDDEGNIHLLLMHASDMSSVPPGKPVHCPFKPEEIHRAGFQFALLGHYHQGRLSSLQESSVNVQESISAPGYGYPGTPEPLGFDETGHHGVIVLEIGDGKVKAELRPISQFAFVETELDISAATSRDDIKSQLQYWADEARGNYAFARAMLKGQLQPEIELDLTVLREAIGSYFRYFDLQNRTYPAYDFSELAEEKTVRGAFVREMLNRIKLATGEEKETLRSALTLGLQAFEKREILEQV